MKAESSQETINKIIKIFNKNDKVAGAVKQGNMALHLLSKNIERLFSPSVSIPVDHFLNYFY